MAVPDYAAALQRDTAGLRVGLVAEGFGHPGLSEPSVDKRFDDATCLAVAHAFERIRGEFPAPPQPTG